jgi:Regulator of chromosome condensation (RCC1) repeat
VWFASEKKNNFRDKKGFIFLFLFFFFWQKWIGDGNIYSWGRGMFGRLGTGKEADELIPVNVSFTHSSQSSANLYPQFGDTKNPKFVEIAAGAYHSLALTGKEYFFWLYSLCYYGNNSV